MKFRIMTGLVFLILFSAGISAQQDSGLEIQPEKVATIDAVLTTVYNSISGGAGVERNWDEFRALFIKDARLIAVHKDKAGKIILRRMSVNEFIANANPYFLKNGFFEKGVHNIIESFGNIAHVFSTYESRNNVEDPEPFSRGINSFQLMSDGNRWLVVSIFWQDEGPENPIPEMYLN